MLPPRRIGCTTGLVVMVDKPGEKEKRAQGDPSRKHRLMGATTGALGEKSEAGFDWQPPRRNR